MANEPGANIENELKAYAEERRRAADAMPPMPGPMRQQLLAETRRLYAGAPEPASGDEEKPSWWKIWWPFAAVGLSGAAALVLCLQVWLQDTGSPQQLQRRNSGTAVPATEGTLGASSKSPSVAASSANERPAAIDNPRPAVMAPAPAVKRDEAPSPGTPAQAKDTLLAGRSAAKELPSRVKVESATETETETVVEPGRTRQLVSRPMKARVAPEPQPTPIRMPSLPTDSVATPQALAKTPPGPVAIAARAAVAPGSAATPAAVAATEQRPVIAPDSLAGSIPAQSPSPEAARELANNSNVRQARFLQDVNRRAFRQNLNSPPTTAVLDDFTMQMDGNTVTVIDSDGSVYSGTTVSAAPVVASAGARLPGKSSKQDRSGKSVATRAFETDAAVTESGTSPQAGAPSGVMNFTVTGTNRSSGKKVVFRGQVDPGLLAAPGRRQNQSLSLDQANTASTSNSAAYLNAANARASIAASNLGVSNQSQVGRNQSQSYGRFLSNATQNQNQSQNQGMNGLRGRAKVGERTEINVNASPVGP